MACLGGACETEMYRGLRYVCRIPVAVGRHDTKIEINIDLYRR
jgi:hypothetical protein